MVLRFLLCVLLLPSFVQAATFWDETFETTGAGNRFGLLDNSGPVQLSTASAYAGSKSARYMFDSPQVGSCLPGHANFIDCGGFYDATFTPTSNLWRRFWVRVSVGFVVASPTTKLTKAGTAGMSDWITIGNNQTTDETKWQLVLGNFTSQPELWGGVLRHDGQWQCVEVHEQLNTPGVSDGVYELYLDGTRWANYTNVKYRETGDNNLFNYVRLYRQYGSGDMFFDDYAVGDTRIGCGAAPPTGDVTAPTAPSTPTLTVSGGNQISLSWTNGTDAVGVTGTNIRRSAGAASTPSAILTTINNGTTSTYADTTVAAGTLYRYSINNFDAAGNQSTYSAVAEATTGSSFRTQTISEAFNRADNTDLGSSWDAGYTNFFGAHSNLAIVSNQLRVPATGAGSVETYNAIVPANNQWAQLTFVALTAANATEKSPGILLRTNAPGNQTGYECRIWHWTGGSQRARISRWDGLVAYTPLVDNTTVSWQTGDKIRCEAEGTTIRFYQIRGTTETLILSTTDATYASGRVGLIHYIGAGTTADVQIDDFLAGEFSVSAPTPPAITAVTSGSRTSTTVTYTGTPSMIRVATQNGSKLEPLSSFPSGVYTFPAEVLSTMTDFFCMYARDALGVENTTGYVCGSVPYTYDTAAPVLSNPLPTAQLPNGTTSTQITATIDKTSNVVCRYDTSDVAYGSMQTTTPVTLVGLSASATVTGLVTGSNLFYMRCNYTDIVGAEHPNLTSLVFTVTVAASTADVTVPSTVTGLVASPLSNSQAELSWGIATDNLAIDGYNVYLSIGTGNTTYILEASIGATTTRTIVNLAPNTIHNFVVKARDTSQNLSAAYSNVVTITTAAVPDVTPPSTITNFRVIGIYANSGVFTWDPPTDDRGPASVTIELCTGVGCSNYAVVAARYTLEQLIVSLSPSTTYSLRAIAVDASNNPSAAYSNVVTFTTNASGLPQPRLEVPYSTPRLSSGTRLPR